MKNIKSLAFPLIVAAFALIIPACGTGKPQSEVDKMIGEMLDYQGIMNDAVAAKVIEHGEEAIPPLLKRIMDDKQTGSKAYSRAYAYSTVLTQIKVEPARFNACKEMLKHPNQQVRLMAVEGLAYPGATDEGIKLAIDLAKNSTDLPVKAIALRAISSAETQKFDAEICSLLRKALSDPDQNVREHAQRGIDRRRANGGCE